ncbi:MAG: putative cytokinetic ring protein SteA [Actinomycetota bacterium]|nr:putative cytokinetic ring protein SteA [Actinomycetota bacterium]
MRYLRHRRANGAGEFRLRGKAVLGRRTKEMVPRLGPTTIPIIDHENLDRVAAESLVDAGVRAVVNAANCSTGLYPNLGPLTLARAGVYILDGVGGKVFDRLKSGEEIELRGDGLYRGGTLVATGEHLDLEAAERHLRESEEGVGEALESFAQNTVEFMRIERDILFSTLDVPVRLSREIAGRQVLVVVRGYDYRQDLAALGPYLRGVRPFVIGVDGGADAVLEVGWRPDLIFGDMDSVSDRALRSAGHVLVHGYETGYAPGMERVKEAGLKDAEVLAAPGLSEDIAILLADQCGAELIVAVGTHVGLVEFLDKGRKGASSTFLTRLKVGGRLVDAKGVSKLYPSRASVGQLVALVIAGLVAVSAVVVSSDQIAEIFQILAIKLRLFLGI